MATTVTHARGAGDRGKPAIVVVVATVPSCRRGRDPGCVTVTAPTGRVCGGRPRRALWRLDPSGRHPRGHRPAEAPGPEPEDFELCLALLDAAIARAERWYARRERVLADFDLRAADMVRRLRNA